MKTGATEAKRERGRPALGTYLRFQCRYDGCNNRRPINIYRAKRSGIAMRWCDKCSRAMDKLIDQPASEVDWADFVAEAEKRGEDCIMLGS